MTPSEVISFQPAEIISRQTSLRGLASRKNGCCIGVKGKVQCPVKFNSLSHLQPVNQKNLLKVDVHTSTHEHTHSSVTALSEVPEGLVQLHFTAPCPSSYKNKNRSLFVELRLTVCSSGATSGRSESNSLSEMRKTQKIMRRRAAASSCWDERSRCSVCRSCLPRFKKKLLDRCLHIEGCQGGEQLSCGAK